jgi:hypothetical protein
VVADRFSLGSSQQKPQARCDGGVAAQMGQRRRAAPTLDARAQGVNRSPMRLLASAFHSRDDCAPLFRAAARFVSWEGSSSSHDPFFSRAAASEGSMTVSGVQAAGVMGARRRGGGAVQPWVKPEVDPPRGCALPRGS